MLGIVTNNAPSSSLQCGNDSHLGPSLTPRGNTATCNQTVTVIDTQNPTTTCPADVSMYLQMQAEAVPQALLWLAHYCR
ncbi:MAG: hypothetical protein R2756_13015 [Bacteroidales bacterium]